MERRWPREASQRWSESSIARSPGSSPRAAAPTRTSSRRWSRRRRSSRRGATARSMTSLSRRTPRWRPRRSTSVLPARCSAPRVGRGADVVVGPRGLVAAHEVEGSAVAGDRGADELITLDEEPFATLANLLAPERVELRLDGAAEAALIVGGSGHQSAAFAWIKIHITAPTTLWLVDGAGPETLASALVEVEVADGVHASLRHLSMGCGQHRFPPAAYASWGRRRSRRCRGRCPRGLPPHAQRRPPHRRTRARAHPLGLRRWER